MERGTLQRRTLSPGASESETLDDRTFCLSVYHHADSLRCSVVTFENSHWRLVRQNSTSDYLFDNAANSTVLKLIASPDPYRLCRDRN